MISSLSAPSLIWRFDLDGLQLQLGYQLQLGLQLQFSASSTIAISVYTIIYTRCIGLLGTFLCWNGFFYEKRAAIQVMRQNMWNGVRSILQPLKWWFRMIPWLQCIKKTW